MRPGERDTHDGHGKQDRRDEVAERQPPSGENQPLRALTSIVLVILLIASIMVIVGVLTVPLTYWLRRGSELGALLKERLETLGNPLAFFDEIGTALSQVTGGDESASAVNLSSSNIVTVSCPC